MKNSEKRPCPTGPGWWYRDELSPERRVVYVQSVHRGVARASFVRTLVWADSASIPVDDARWLGPVPMPGEWAPRGLFNQLWTELLMTSPAQNSIARNVIDAAHEWDDANPAPEATP